MVAAVIASFLVSGWITRPLRHMAEIAGQIAAGDYAERVAYESDDDIGLFARAFNNMAGQLEKTEEVRRNSWAPYRTSCGPRSPPSRATCGPDGRGHPSRTGHL